MPLSAVVLAMASAATLIPPLAWELPCATGVALKKQNKTKKHFFFFFLTMPMACGISPAGVQTQATAVTRATAVTMLEL